MATGLTIDDRIDGCLVGAAIGAEFGWNRYVHPERFQAATAQEAFALELTPSDGDEIGPRNAGSLTSVPGRIWAQKATPLISLGVRVYTKVGGRATPEDFGRELADDRAIEYPAFSLDGLHSTQELLRQGMPARISGLGAAAYGQLVAAMPAVGIYHYGDPEYAYLDGVELASVAQPRLGADWAGLAAAAIAAAFDGQLSCKDVVQTVLDLAHENNKDVYYELNHLVRQAALLDFHGEDPDLDWWYHCGGRYDSMRKSTYLSNNPLAFVLPLLQPFDGDAQRLFALLLWPEGGWIPDDHIVNPVLAGAILGARHGKGAFCEEWLAWAEPVADQWSGLKEVVASRAAVETSILREYSSVAETASQGRSRLEDKIYGCLLAGAIGNAMGSVAEAMHYPEIDQMYPEHITTVLVPSRLETEDDNQMAMLLVETYLGRDGKPPLARHFGRTWYDRVDRDMFSSLCMGAVYDMIREGWDPRIAGHWSRVTGSTVMCMEPVGMYHVADPEFAAIDATAISYMYQRGLDVEAARILAATVAEALRADASVDSVCQAAIAAAPAEPWNTFDQRAFGSCRAYLEACLEIAARYDDVFAVRQELYERCMLYHLIDPMELLGFALAMFYIAQGDVRTAAIGGANIGRDTDTIAGRSAMFAGALRGSAGVPDEWIALFGARPLDRISTNAQRLSELVLERKRERLARRHMVAGISPHPPNPSPRVGEGVS